jgi:hypothetical protein
MSYCPVWASRALLIRPEYILSEVAVWCLLIIKYLLEELTAGYLLEEWTASRLLRLSMLILQASLFGSH